MYTIRKTKKLSHQALALIKSLLIMPVSLLTILVSLLTVLPADRSHVPAGRSHVPANRPHVPADRSRSLVAEHVPADRSQSLVTEHVPTDCPRHHGLVPERIPADHSHTDHPRPRGLVPERVPADRPRPRGPVPECVTANRSHVPAAADNPHVPEHDSRRSIIPTYRSCSQSFPQTPMTMTMRTMQARMMEDQVVPSEIQKLMIPNHPSLAITTESGSTYSLMTETITGSIFTLKTLSLNATATTSWKHKTSCWRLLQHIRKNMKSMKVFFSHT